MPRCCRVINKLRNITGTFGRNMQLLRKRAPLQSKVVYARSTRKLIGLWEGKGRTIEVLVCKTNGLQRLYLKYSKSTTSNTHIRFQRR